MRTEAGYDRVGKITSVFPDKLRRLLGYEKTAKSAGFCIENKSGLFYCNGSIVRQIGENRFYVMPTHPSTGSPGSCRTGQYP